MGSSGVGDEDLERSVAVAVCSAASGVNREASVFRRLSVVSKSRRFERMTKLRVNSI